MRASMSIALASLAALVLLTAPAAARQPAPGAPGAPPTWLPSDKHGFGTSTTRASEVWFTLRRSAMSEAYYPDLSTPSLRSLELVVVDRGRARRDATQPAWGRPGGGLTFRQTVLDRGGAWRLTKTFVTDPKRSSILVHVALTSLTHRRLKLFALVDPALSNDGSDDRAATAGGALSAWDATTASAPRARGIARTSSAYRGTARHPWVDLARDGRLHRYDATAPGNV